MDHAADRQDPGSEVPQTPAAPGRRPRWPLLAGAALVLAASAFGVSYWLDARHYESTDDAFIDTEVVHVAPQVAGVINDLAVAPNQHVKPGDLLVTINPDTTQAVFQQQRAGLAQGTAQAGQAEAQVGAAQGSLNEALAQARIEQANTAKAKQDLDRLLAARKLDPNAVAETQLDEARTTYTAAQARAVSAEAAITAARAQLAGARQASGAAVAQQRGAEARLEEAQITLGQNRIAAPMAGHITNIAINRGSYVAPGTQMMALVPDDLWITANFKETQLADIRPGQPVEISIDAYPDATFTGHVASIQRGAGQAFQLFPPQNATGNFVKVVQRVPVRIVFDKLDLTRYPLGPGMSVVPRVRVR